MPHIHTKPGEHDHTASAFIVRTDFEEPKIILHKHKKLKRYMQFGGHIETTENPWQAIVHELKEESGYLMSQLKILQPKQRIKSLSIVKQHPIPIYHNTHNFDETHFHTDIAYAFIADQEPEHDIAENESNDIKLLNRSELIALPENETIASVREAALFALDVCLPEWERLHPSSFD